MPHNVAPGANGVDNYKELLQEAKKNEDKIIKMQANVRGFLQRKVHKQANEFADPKPNISHRSGREKIAGNKNMLQNKGKPVLQGNS